ncbi:MAG: polysaccharide deacetylase family protein [Candidatus Geothermincolia bacterium]
MYHRIIALLLALSLTLAVSAGGCGSSEPVTATQPGATPEEAEPPEVAALEPSLPAWRLVDRMALAASLGWGEVTRGNTASMRVALTFDAGADGAPTPAILDALAAAGVKSTFFLTGRFADAYPLTVRRIAAEGHEIANHSYTHPRFPELAAPEVISEIERTEARIMELTGLTTRPYFRFPYGARSAALICQVNAKGYLSVFWTVDALDWEPDRSPASVQQRVVSLTGPGAIVLMHCGSPQEAEILPTIIDRLQLGGYELVTLTELLSD